MITCPKCGKKLSDGTKFCGGCGAQIFKTIFCPKCSKQTSTEFAFCQSCGASITETPTKKKKLHKKAIMFGGIGVAVIVALILVISLFFGGKAKNNFTLYLKDNEIFFSDMKKDSETWQLTSKFVDSEDVNDDDLAYASSTIGSYICTSEDGKYIFFPDKTTNDDGFNLYYRELGKPEAEAVKIDSDIQSYAVNTSATIVTYLKGEERNLYQYKLAEDSKDKVASEVEGFEVSDDGTKVSYINSDGSLYLKYEGKDREKIASEVTSLEYLTDDFKTVYYIKEGFLYKQTEGEDRVEIASDVYDVIKIYETGEIYYLTSEASEISLTDYITDDMKDVDATMTEPTYPNYPDSPDYPSRRNYDTDIEYDVAYETYKDAYEAWEAECDHIKTEYYATREAWYAKQSRDELREDLEEEVLEQSNYSLYFYNGIEATVITDAFVGDYNYFDYTYASDAPVVIYEAYNQSNLEKVKLSEVESVYDIKEMVKAALFSSSERYITVKTTATIVEQEKEACSFNINSSGTVVYYIDNIPDEKSYGELYRISITNGSVGKAEVYDSDVYTGYCHFVNDGKFEYYKDYKDSKGELYVDKVRIDYDVSLYSAVVYSDSDKVIYFTDWNDEKNYGTLKINKNGESVKVADDVHDFSTMSDGRILYLCNYSLNDYKGELYVWKNGEARKIDDNVIAIIPIYEAKYRGDSYGW